MLTSPAAVDFSFRHVRRTYSKSNRQTLKTLFADHLENALGLDGYGIWTGLRYRIRLAGEWITVRTSD